MSRYVKSSNPFEDDEEEDYEKIGRPSASSSRSTNSKYSHSQDPFSTGSEWNRSDEESSPFNDRLENIRRQIDNSENNQLESTQRALASIYDSEAMGVATAEELIRQGETLDNIENKTVGMQQTLKSSQRHLNNIKSVFGGIKNWWRGDKNASKEEADNSTSRARLRETVDKMDKPKSDFSGFYEEDNEKDLDSRFMANAPRSSSGGGYSVIQPVTRSAREEELDENLVLMSQGMGRLKGLAMGLGQEIEEQNEQLDRINQEVNVTDSLVQNQNSQMRRILRK